MVDGSLYVESQEEVYVDQYVSVSAVKPPEWTHCLNSK